MNGCLPKCRKKNRNPQPKAVMQQWRTTEEPLADNVSFFIKKGKPKKYRFRTPFESDLYYSLTHLTNSESVGFLDPLTLTHSLSV